MTSLIVVLLVSLVFCNSSFRMVMAYSHSGPHDYNSRPTPSCTDDWLEAELAIHPSQFPARPSAELTPKKVALSCLRSLQLVDNPSPGAGLDRIFPHLMWQCRSAVTSRDGIDDTPSKFRERAILSPILQVFMGCSRIELGQPTLSPGTTCRGDIVSYPVRVQGAPVHAFQHKSGILRDGISAEPPVTDMIIRLERNRRPPYQGCFMIKDIADVNFAKGGIGWARHEGV